MAKPYTRFRDPVTGGVSDWICRVADMAFIPPTEANPDWRAYQEWLAAGNEPDPYIPDPAPGQGTPKGT